MAIVYFISAFPCSSMRSLCLSSQGLGDYTARLIMCKDSFLLPFAQVLVSLCRVLDFALRGYDYQKGHSFGFTAVRKSLCSLYREESYLIDRTIYVRKKCSLKSLRI